MAAGPVQVSLDDACRQRWKDLSQEDLADLEEEMKETLHDSVHRDASLACEEVDRLIAMALRMLPVEIQKMPARQAFMPVESLFTPGFQQSSADIAAHRASAEKGPMPVQKSRHASSNASAASSTASGKKSSPNRLLLGNHGSGSRLPGNGYGKVPMAHVVVEKRLSDETPEEKLSRLQSGMRALEEVSEEITGLSDNLHDLMTVDLTHHRRSLLLGLEDKMKYGNTPCTEEPGLCIPRNHLEELEA